MMPPIPAKIALEVRGRALPVWSPKGTSVVYGDANGNVYRADAGGGGVSVQISPDGQWIV